LTDARPSSPPVDHGGAPRLARCGARQVDRAKVDLRHPGPVGVPPGPRAGTATSSRLLPGLPRVFDARQPRPRSLRARSAARLKSSAPLSQPGRARREPHRPPTAPPPPRRRAGPARRPLPGPAWSQVLLQRSAPKEEAARLAPGRHAPRYARVRPVERRLAQSLPRRQSRNTSLPPPWGRGKDPGHPQAAPAPLHELASPPTHDPARSTARGIDDEHGVTAGHQPRPRNVGQGRRPGGNRLVHGGQAPRRSTPRQRPRIIPHPINKPHPGHR